MEAYSQREEEKKDERNALIITLATSIILALIILFCTAFTEPDPLPEIPEVVMFEFAGAAGGGSSSSSSSSSSSENTAEVASDANPTDVESVTENTTETPVVANENSGETETETPREVNSNTLFPGDSGTGDDDGGGGGTGNGNGNGNGDATGDGSADFGDGDYNLAGRGILKKPTLDGNFPEVGKVVVDVYVDRMGNVFKARVNRLKTDIANEAQIKKAVDAAKKSKWTAKPDATVEQKGSITFHFNKN